MQPATPAGVPVSTGACACGTGRRGSRTTAARPGSTRPPSMTSRRKPTAFTLSIPPAAYKRRRGTGVNAMLEWASLRSRHEGGNGGDLPAEPRIIEPQPEKKAGIALALGGGAARGWAHIGVLRALDEAGIKIDMTAGTSIGALVGGCYLAGKLDELEEFARSLTRRRMFNLLDITFRGSGLFGGMKLDSRMREHLDGVSIEDLSRPFVAVCTELHTGHEIWLSTGPLVESMRASYALPGVFAPVRWQGRILVDGALVNPVPVSVCRAYEQRLVLAVNLHYDQFGRAAVIKHAQSQQDSFPGSLRSEKESRLGITSVMM